jgi:hypothetical protein
MNHTIYTFNNCDNRLQLIGLNNSLGVLSDIRALNANYTSSASISSKHGQNTRPTANVQYNLVLHNRINTIH